MSAKASMKRLLGRQRQRARERWTPSPSPSPSLPPAPFIVGAPRSGTTLLRLMLDAHPELAIPPETYFIPKAVKNWQLAEKRRRRGEDPVQAFYDTVTGHTRWKDFHLDAEAFKHRLDQERPDEVGDAVRAFYGLYVDKVGKPRWGDKTPFYVRRMKQIQDVIPEARFVHLIRDGRAVTL